MSAPSYSTDIVSVVASGDLTQAEVLLEGGGVDIETQSPQSLSLLQIASSNGDGDLVHLLLVHGADMDFENNEGWTALHFACSCNEIGAAKVLLTYGANVDYIRAADHQTPLHCAVLYGSLEMVKLLVTNGAMVDARDSHGWTPLICAAAGNCVDVMKTLYLAGATVDAVTDEGYNAIIMATNNGHVHIVQTLIDCQADLNASGVNEWTPLYTATFWGFVDIAKVLVENKAALDSYNTEGMTAVNHAAYKGNIEILELLVANGACLDFASNNSLTPLHNAALEGHTRVVKLLLDNGADMEKTNNQGEVALHDAAREGYVEIVKLLIDHGANLERKNKDGMTPMLVAAENGEFGVTQLLISRGARMDAESNDGWTLSALAAVYGLTYPVRPTSSAMKAPWFVPEWLIDRCEIDLDDTKAFHLGIPDSVHYGRWRGIEVMVKKANTSGKHAKGTFLREVQTWYRLDHPYVIKLLGACHLGHPFYVFERTTNGRLDTYFAEIGNLQKLWQRLYEAALGLQFLHEHGILHGSLRCSNILIGDDGKTKLSGYGFNTIYPRNDRLQRDKGLEHWKPVEMFYDDREWMESDVFSLGRCILEAVSGEFPWGRHVTTFTIAQNVKSGANPVRPEGFTDTQWDLIERMCYYYRKQRLTLPEVIQELQVFAKG